MDSTTREVDNIISLLKLKQDGSLLDLCCGPGRHTLEFSRRGFNITGVDRTIGYLDKAKNKADAENLKIDFVNKDMRDFKHDNSFDAAIMMFTSFGYFEDPEDDELVLKNVYASLKKNGKLLMEQMGKEILIRKFQPRDWKEVDGNFLLENREVDKEWKYIKNRWIVIKNRMKHEYKLALRLYSAIELSNLLKSTGFSKVSVYGNLFGMPYDENAERLVVVAVKN